MRAPACELRIEVTGLCEAGWFSRNLTLRQWARQRARLQECEVLHVWLVGSLV